MDLTSCDGCGVVLDRDKVHFTPESRLYRDDGSVDQDHFSFNGDRYLAYVNCPICEEEIHESD